MTIQVIFFVAIALFLALFLRKMSWTGKVLEKVGPFLGLVFRHLGASIRSLSKKINNAKLKRASKASPSVGQASGGIKVGGRTDFWSDETIEDKPELLTHYEEGEALFRSAKYEEAERFFLTAATRNPKDPKVYARLGLIYLHRKNYSDAIEALKVAVKLDKYNPSRHFNLALAYAGKNDRQRAIATIREAISLDPVSEKYRALLEQLLNEGTIEKQS